MEGNTHPLGFSTSVTSLVDLYRLLIYVYVSGKMLVRMADVEAAIQEMFQAPHIQVSSKGTPCGAISIFILVNGDISCR